MNVQDVCAKTRFDERSLFVLAHKIFGGPYQHVTEDFARWKKDGILPAYVQKYLAYRV